MWASARSLGVWGHAPPGAFGRAAASPQTRQMRCWLSAAQATYHSFPSLPPTKTRSLRCTAFFPPKPLCWVSAGALLGEVIKTPVKGNPLRLSGITAYAEEFSICGREMKCFFIRFLRDYFSCTQRFFGVPACGWYHYPRCAIHAVETLDARGSRRRIYRFYAVPEFAPCGQNIPSSGTHATPAPNRAHSGSRAETQGVFTT